MAYASVRTADWMVDRTAVWPYDQPRRSVGTGSRPALTRKTEKSTTLWLAVEPRLERAAWHVWEPKMKPVVRLTVNMDPDVAGLLEDLAGQWGTSKTEALHRAIVTTYELQQRLRQPDTHLQLSSKGGSEVTDLRISTLA